ncbi:MAG TPA: DNA circularization N-terminal domain-containing protein [Fibrobacteria bacterium]|nr:DNA circularization N-terminal domain-containing protein [Fibrobacteria bacterium]
MKISVTIAGLHIDCVDLTDTWKHSIAKHEYPGQNGADLEWLGASAGEHPFKTVFIGMEALAKYVELLQVLRKGASVQVEHPLHGTFPGMVESVTAKYDHRIDTAEVDFVVVQDTVKKELVFRPHLGDLAISTAQQAIDQAVIPALRAPVAPASLPSVDFSSPTWADQLNALGLGNKISGYVSRLGEAVGRIAALRAAITSPVSAGFAALQFASDVPGQVVRQIAEFLDLFAGLRTAVDSPVLGAQRAIADLEALISQYAGTDIADAMLIQGAIQGGISASQVMAADEDLLRAQVAIENSVSFDSRGNRLGVSPRIMPSTPIQVARLTLASRQLLLRAAQVSRAPDPLLSLALAIHRQYRDRLARFESIREITVDRPTPLHLICLQHGLPYQTAERLCRLNGMKNPSFTEGKVLIYVPAV